MCTSLLCARSRLSRLSNSPIVCARQLGQVCPHPQTLILRSALPCLPRSIRSTISKERRGAPAAAAGGETARVSFRGGPPVSTRFQPREIRGHFLPGRDAQRPQRVASLPPTTRSGDERFWPGLRRRRPRTREGKQGQQEQPPPGGVDAPWWWRSEAGAGRHGCPHRGRPQWRFQTRFHSHPPANPQVQIEASILAGLAVKGVVGMDGSGTNGTERASTGRAAARPTRSSSGHPAHHIGGVAPVHSRRTRIWT